MGGAQLLTPFSPEQMVTGVSTSETITRCELDEQQDSRDDLLHTLTEHGSKLLDPTLEQGVP